MKQNIENTLKNCTETSEIECQIFLFEPETSRIAGRKKTIYDQQIQQGSYDYFHIYGSDTEAVFKPDAAYHS